jgi:hypothetical protein
VEYAPKALADSGENLIQGRRWSRPLERILSADVQTFNPNFVQDDSDDNRASNGGFATKGRSEGRSKEAWHNDMMATLR